MFISCDVVFEEGHPRRTSADVGEKDIPSADNGTLLTFDSTIVPSIGNRNEQDLNRRTVDHRNNPEQRTVNQVPDQQVPDQHDIPVEPRRSTHIPQPTNASIQSMEYQKREVEGKGRGQEWATNMRVSASMAINYTEDDENTFACLAETKSSHHIPRSYKHAITTDQERWMLPMKVLKCLQLEHY